MSEHQYRDKHVIINSDLAGPMTPESIVRKKYMMTLYAVKRNIRMFIT